MSRFIYCVGSVVVLGCAYVGAKEIAKAIPASTIEAVVTVFGFRRRTGRSVQETR